MVISAIVARSLNNTIGINNQLPWHLPEDLKHFKRTTLNKHILMGRKTLESLPFPLRDRKMLCVSKKRNYYYSEANVFNSIPEAFTFALNDLCEELIIIGGQQIYSQTQRLWDKIYISEVQTQIQGDATFVNLDEDQWVIETLDTKQADKDHAFNIKFTLWTRKKP